MLHYPAATPSDPVEAAAETPAAAFLPRYLARIGYAGPVAPTLKVLAALQAAHIATIPFEAIDALTGAGIDIGAAAVDAKLIGQRRGGYCFEQNSLFLRALIAIGFDAEGLLGRVRWMLPDEAPETPRTHMVVRVTIDGRPWLADVGFGAAVPPQPLAMDVGRQSPDRQGYGDAPVQAYIAAMPGRWKSEVGRRLDALIEGAFPGAQGGANGTRRFYGVEEQTWFLSLHCFAKYIKVAFFRGTSLEPGAAGRLEAEG
jgi:hypothetical protein